MNFQPGSEQTSAPTLKTESSRLIGIVFGLLLLSTAVVPWGMQGNQLLWPRHLFDEFFATNFKILVSAAWIAGLVAVLSGIFLRGMARATCYALTGVLTFGIYLCVSRGSSAASLLFLSAPAPGVWIQTTAVAALLILLFSTGTRSSGTSAPSTTAFQFTSALLVFIAAVYSGITAGKTLSAGLLPGLLALSAAILAIIACLQSARQCFAPSINIVAARRLLFVSLILMAGREIAQPLFLCQRPLTALQRWNDYIVLLAPALIALEGLTAIATRLPQSFIPVSAALVLGVIPGFFDWSSNVYSVPQGTTPAAEIRRSGDWNQWCGAEDRNQVRDEKDLPDSFESIVGKKNSDLNNIKWIVPLGTSVLGSPVIANGKVFIGGELAEGKNEYAMLWCFQESDGKLVWRMKSPYIPNLYNVHTFGTCSTPTVEGDRLYMLGHLGDVLCVSTDGLAAGNRGPFQDEVQYFAIGRKVASARISPEGNRLVQCTEGAAAPLGPRDADIVWRFDLMQQANCWPFNALNAAIVVRGKHLYVPTCSTYSDIWFKDESAQKWIQAWKAKYSKTSQPYDSPALIILDKETGKLLARDHTDIFEHTFHGAHSSPAVGNVNGSDLIFYGGGNGTVYAFDSQFTTGESGKPGDIKLVWSFNCVPGWIERAEIIATPVFYKNRVYVSIGNDLTRSGDRAGPGRLVCIDASQKGPVTHTAKIWSFDDIRSSDTTVAIADGLLYTGDAAGNFYCIDADTGKLYWQHTTLPIWSSPLVADGKVYLGTHGHGLLVFAHSKEKKLLAQNMGDADIVASPALANGVLYVASQRHLYAIQSGKTGGLTVQEKSNK